MIFKKMGVMNITPDSFSDGGEFSLSKIHSFGQIDILDVGAESTAPMNDSISADEEWSRLEPWMGELKKLGVVLSLDTYHPETIFRVAKGWNGPLVWNDVSGKFDDHVERFLGLSSHFMYVFCHNLAPSRELTGRHMDYVREGDGLTELAEFFRPYLRERVVLDPCLGFSKTYEQNWAVLDRFHELQAMVPHDKWLVGFSRKSFLRKKYGLGFGEELDRVHVDEVRRVLARASGEVWVRTHRPELI